MNRFTAAIPLVLLLAAVAPLAGAEAKPKPKPGAKAPAKEAGTEAGSAAEGAAAAGAGAVDPARLPRQFLLFDTIAVHTEDAQMMNLGGYGHKPTVTRAQRIPPDWTAPVDYAGGSYHIRYEILEKPNARRIHFCVVMSTPAGAKGKADLPSHPGSAWFTAPGVAIEQGLLAKGFRKTYQGRTAGWSWKDPWPRLWQDTYRMGSSQYGPSSVFPVKVRITMTLIAKDHQYHPYGNLGEMDFRTLRAFTDGARLIEAGRPGQALALAERVKPADTSARAEEARWVAERLRAHVDQRKAEIEAYWKEEADCAADEMKTLAADFAGCALGEQLAAEAAAVEGQEATKTARRARELWRKVLAETAALGIPDGIGTEKWDEAVPLPPDLAAKHAERLERIRAGSAEVLALVSSRNWQRMVKGVLRNLGLRDPKDRS